MGNEAVLPVLVVDDEERVLRSCQTILASGGIERVLMCQDPRQALDIVDRTPVGVMLVDLWMPHMSGEDLLRSVAENHPEVPVIVVTASDEINTAVRCMRLGATDYIVKPVDRERLLSSIQRALDLNELRRECSELRRGLLEGDLKHADAFSEIVTCSPKMLSIFRYIEAIACSREPVLILGETGTGKELLARAVHAASGRRGAFVAINAAGLDDNIFSDTLFGHMRGAFTGADRYRAGMVEQAAGGTLFLDEMGDLAQTSQVKLLRLIQEREYFPLGSDVAKPTDARIIAATHRDLPSLQRSGAFRKDLFYRLWTHHIEIPPLKDRAEDVPILLQSFLEKAAETLGKTAPSFPPELITLLQTYHFPGNVRELQSMVFDALSRHQSRVLSMQSFKERIQQELGTEAQEAQTVTPKPLFEQFTQLPTLRAATEGLIAEALRRSNGNQAIAARMLGISRPALNRRLSRQGEDATEEV